MGEQENNARILLVDDVMENIQVAGTVLKENGYQLNIARNGKQALHVCEKITPDLILLDLMMPEMDGFQCCAELKLNDKLKDIPVIFLTSKTETSEMIKGFETGAVDYIFKPFNTEELLARINVQLTLRKAHLEQARLTKKASRYISPNIFKAIYMGEKDTVLETTQKPLSIFFSDIVNFTNITESMGDKDLTTWLNNYFDKMSATVVKHGGTLDKFIGDAVMVFFGDPETKGEKEDAEACVRMALDMIQEANAMEIEIRVGINTSPAFVGNFGTKDQMNYTIIGSAVNLAARLENNSDPGKILISHPTYELVKEDFWCEERGPIRCKGFEKDIQTYWVNG